MTTTTTRDVVAVKVETAARMLDTSQYTVLHWIRTGRLPATKVGRTWRVRVDDLETVLAGRGLGAVGATK